MSFWKNKRVLVTGHTGFKGSWLCLWLQSLEAKVAGYALSPATPNGVFTLAQTDMNMTSVIGDMRDYDALNKLIEDFKPEIVFHMAAQALVRESYRNPIHTFDTNIMGTVKLFDALRTCETVKLIVNVTTDKCYENKESIWGYREVDQLGGDDPYSCSKACVELITNSFRRSYFQNKGVLLATVRAGNVIGGGDWADERLIPDSMKAIMENRTLEIRNPLAIRPWQFVLEPVGGYMLLAERLWKYGSRYEGAWNFGPAQENMITVRALLDKINKEMDSQLKWNSGSDNNLKETRTLRLDCSKAKYELEWQTLLDIENTVKWTVDWYKHYMERYNMRDYTLDQLSRYKDIFYKDLRIDEITP